MFRKHLGQFLLDLFERPGPRAALIAVSLMCLVLGVVLVTVPTGPLPMAMKVICAILIQLGGGVFFPLTVGSILQLRKAIQERTILSAHINNCSDAGLIRFFPDRGSDAEVYLERAFNEHREGDILLMGSSLRLFLAPGQHFEQVLRRNMKRYGKHGVRIKAVLTDPVRNPSVPIRAFIEEFNPDGTLPWGTSRTPFQWDKQPEPDLIEFCAEFVSKHGPEAAEADRCRIITDTQASGVGVHELNRDMKTPCVLLRRTICAPYCTAVIFPDRCYFTPNLLFPTAPVNMPLLVFASGAPPYEKILTHFRFLWWTGQPLDTDQPGKEAPR